MKSLLIIGAGSHGRVVAETAEVCGYDKIDFLDDNSRNAIGKKIHLRGFPDHTTGLSSASGIMN
jgi:hypothetical protein